MSEGFSYINLLIRLLARWTAQIHLFIEFELLILIKLN